MIKKINYYKVDSEQLIKKCPKCPGNIYNAPELTAQLDLTDTQKRAILNLEMGIAYCPSCNFITLWIGKPENLVL